MLRFINNRICLLCPQPVFQYIPCYGLSAAVGIAPINLLEFQYIPCYGLSFPAYPICEYSTYFNTSHVTVYRNQIDPNTGLDIFQYIPCYGLSYFTQDQLILRRDFNTSHVTVYRHNGFEYILATVFQYIPCYGLSCLSSRASSFFRSFQYIPCYGLSFKLNYLIIKGKGFQYIPCYGLSSSGAQFGTNRAISIHPMLRFIAYPWSVSKYRM